MAVYVDDAFILYRGMRMSHLIADTTEELYAMVDVIGVQRKWVQFPGTYREHFDIAASKRDLAIYHGAQPISTLELGRKLQARKDT